MQMRVLKDTSYDLLFGFLYKIQKKEGWSDYPAGIEKEAGIAKHDYKCSTHHGDDGITKIGDAC